MIWLDRRAEAEAAYLRGLPEELYALFGTGYLGYTAARLVRLSPRDRRAVSIEVGVQNSGLGLALVFNFFAGLGGTAIVVAWWGTWHLVGGFTIASIWSWMAHRRPAPTAAAAD